MTISPRTAYSTMLRAISEMAVATTVRSLPENPASAASSRPRWRAVRMSCSEPIGKRFSSSIGDPEASRVQDRQAFLQVQSRVDAVEPKAELHHREGDLRTQTHYHRVGPAELAHVGDVQKRSDRERVDDVGGGHIDDDAP